MSFWKNDKSSYHYTDFRSRNFKGKWQVHFINEFVNSMYSSSLSKTQSIHCNYKDEHFPSFLYKFYSPTSYNFSSLMNQQLYLSNPKNFNDPFDSYIFFEWESFKKRFLLKQLKQRKLISEGNSIDTFSVDDYSKIYYSIPNQFYLKFNETFSYIIDKILKTKSNKFQEMVNSLKSEAMREFNKKSDYYRNFKLGVTCFSNFKNVDELMQNTTMWSHYADNHKGYCIKYKLNFDDLKFAEVIKNGLFPIIYTSRTQKVTSLDLLRIEHSKNKIDKTVLKKILKASISKSRFWNYEKEWRLILFEDDLHLLINDCIPFVKADAIFLGCRINNNLKRTLVDYAKVNDIEIFETKQNDSKYELDYYTISDKKMDEYEYYKKLSQINKIDDDNLRTKLYVKLDDIFDK